MAVQRNTEKTAEEKRLIVKGIIIGIEASETDSLEEFRETLKRALETVEVEMGIRRPSPAGRWSP